MPTKVIVALPGEPDYAVRIGSGVMSQVGAGVRETGCARDGADVLVVTDANVAPLYLDCVRSSLTQAGFKVSDVVVPAGEDSKSVVVASEIWSAMAQLAFGRDSLVVALGGGVVGDLAGFIASTYMRGVPVVQVPTTLLAMVDSSVGGKTAINLSEGKNLVGAFFQPSYVCADTDALATLPEREWRCGCAEVAKSAVIDSDDFFFWLSDHAAQMSGREESVVAQAIQKCIVFKAGVVARDKTESAGVRECLNLGHTLGHAIETVAGFGMFSHGAAVAEGMRFAAGIAHDLADASPEFVEAQEALLDSLGLPAFSWRAPAVELLEAMKRDKKSRGGEIRFVLASDVGSWSVRSVSDDYLIKRLKAW